jgi:hypothetical protein
MASKIYPEIPRMSPEDGRDAHPTVGETPALQEPELPSK